MFALKLVVVLCSIRSLVNGEGFHRFTFQDLQEPEPQGPMDEVIEGWITQPVDHFNHYDNRTWLMHYYENSKFLNTIHGNDNIPIVIYIGGQWDIYPGFLKGGLMYELASSYGGVMYHIEHRYYGKSHPTMNTSVENLQYLTADQALADLAYFIEVKKEQLHLERSPVIVFGCSYSGNLAAWARLKYPRLIQGALASSAPVLAKADFYEFYEVVTDSLIRSSEECVANIKYSFMTVQDVLRVEGGPEQLKKYFNLCDVPDVSSPNDISLLIKLLAQVFADTVVYNDVVNGQTKIAALCSNMTDAEMGDILQRFAYIIRVFFNSTGCLDANYHNFIRKFQNIEWGSPVRPWFYQMCTEFGHFATSNSDKSTFGRLVYLRFYIKTCMDLFGDRFNQKFLNSQIERTNIMYGGQQPHVTNVIFTNGDIDPWHVLSVFEDINDSSPAILIHGTSHCHDLYSNVPTDGENIKKARARIRAIIGKWLA